MLNNILKKMGYQKKQIDARANQTKKGSDNIIIENEMQFAKTLEDWKSAIYLATDRFEPNRAPLKELYDNMDLDLHLTSVIESRNAFTQRNPFKIVSNSGQENKDLSWFFERTWFEDFIEYVLTYRYKGTQLIELYDTDPVTQELANVDIIPISHFNPVKGIILKNAGDTQGLPYRSGSLANFYIQVGKNRDLGMYKTMCPNVLAKKLGIGSWLDFIEKYGVPPLFFTTDREDDGYLEKIKQAALMFRSSNVLIGTGNDKAEIGQSNLGKPEMFDGLAERVNSEVSKKILGGSGLTDEKAFVGSTDIQYKIAKDRFEKDKLLVKNIINQQLIPRLIKISPVYLPLQNHFFEWDDTEVQTQEDVRNMISTLAPYFELDTEEISNKTGLTILAQRSNSFQSLPEQDEAVKKKSLNGK